VPAPSHFDVAVVGGGSAGVAAAVSAARSGARSLLVERSDILGGNVGNAFVHTICGLYRLADEGEARHAHPGFPQHFAEGLVRRAPAAERAGGLRADRASGFANSPRAVPQPGLELRSAVGSGAVLAAEAAVAVLLAHRRGQEVTAGVCSTERRRRLGGSAEPTSSRRGRGLSCPDRPARRWTPPS
jgi:glycine/D-amino acid oxidase-like deaminating enzyme